MVSFSPPQAQFRMGCMGRLRLLAVLVVLAGGTVTAMSHPGATTASASSVFYVDGKHGSDANSGTSIGAAVKTLAAGMDLIRSSGRLEVVGYDDYVYYEAATRSYWVGATQGNPAVIEAYGYGTPGYVRPIISGAMVVSRPGASVWYRPNATSYPDVWATPWTVNVPGYESSVKSSLQERIYMDVGEPLGRPVTTPSLSQLQATAGSEYWNGSTLYVHLGIWGGTLADGNPNHHTIEYPYYSGLLISSGSEYVTVQGLRVRHAWIGMGATGTATHVTVKDSDASYNYPMGFFSASGYNTFSNVSGSRNTLQLIKLDNGATHNLVDGATATENMGQGIKISGASTSYNTIRNSVFSDSLSVPSWQRAYGGNAQGIDIEDGAHDNVISDNVIENNVRGLMLYQTTSSGNPLEHNTITGNRFTGNRYGVLIWDGRLSTASSTGHVTFSRNVYVGNVEAVGCDSLSSNKVFDHETIYNTGSAKTVDNSAFHLKAGKVTVTNSIISGVRGYAFYAIAPASMDVMATTVVGAGMGILSGDVSWVTQRAKTAYAPFGPVRVLDTRTGLGLGKVAPLWNRNPQSFPVRGVLGIPSNAVAVTGNLTVTRSSSGGYVALTVTKTSTPTTSTINFPAGDTRAMGVTVPLADDGSIAIVFMSKSGARVEAIFDVTGYFVADSGATYVPLTPGRILDTREPASPVGRLVSGTPSSFQVIGEGGVPADAVAVTGNVTVTNQTSLGYVALTTTATSAPTTSTINFPVGDNRANGVTMPLGAGGKLWAVFKSYAGARVDLIFDVTGYYVSGSGGDMYVPIPPGRLVDTRYDIGITDPLPTRSARTTAIAGRYLMPLSATAVTGNVVVVGQTSEGYVALTKTPTAYPTTSTINFPRGDIRANGICTPLASGTGTLSATFVGRSGSRTDLVIDITGYFLAPDASLGPSDYTLEPHFLSIDPGSSQFLVVGPDSPVYGLGSDGLPLGARWI